MVSSFRWGGWRSFYVIALVLSTLSFTACVAPSGSSNGSESQEISSLASFIDAVRELIGIPDGSEEEEDPDSGRVCTVDRYRQDEGQFFAKADILFVQDTSGSMRDEWQRVALNVKHMMNELPEGVDVRVGVILAHVSNYDGELFSASGEPKVLSNRTMTTEQMGQSLYRTFSAGAEKTDRALGEAAVYSLNSAVRTHLSRNQQLGFFRPDAVLAVVFMSDENELGTLLPEPYPAGIPPICSSNQYWETRNRDRYYVDNGITNQSVIRRLRNLKGETPITTHAFVNLSVEDLLVNNDPNDSCWFDSMGYGYFDIIERTGGVLWSIQDDRTEGLIRIGRAVNDSLDLIHDFKLSKPQEKVDPATIEAFVDDRAVDHSYDPDTNIVHLEDAGTFSSRIRIRHCDFYRIDWGIEDFKGIPTWNSISATWKTPGEDTTAVLRVGLSPDDLSFRRYVIDETKELHAQLVEDLQPETTYYLRVIAEDKFGGKVRSDVIEVTTLAEPILWRIEDFGGTTTHDSATLTWKTPGENTSAILRYGLESGNLTNEVLINDFKVQHQEIVNGLAELTTYFFQVEAKDDRGRTQISEEIALRTKEAPLPDFEIVGFDTPTEKFSAVLFWQTRTIPDALPIDAKGKVYVMDKSENILDTMIIDEFKPNHQVTVEGLQADTEYCFRIEAEDKAERIRLSGLECAVTKPDPILWAIRDFGGETTHETATVRWNTGDESTAAVLKYGLAEDNLDKEIKVEEFKLSHEVLVEDLNELTDYFFQVVAEDQKGRKLASNIIKLTTKEIPITLTIDNLRGEATYNTATIQWSTPEHLSTAILRVGTSPDDLSLQEIQIADAKIDHSQLVVGLSELTDYYFQVEAKDDRNRSVFSDTIMVRTLEEPIFWSIQGLSGTTDWKSATISWNTGSEATKAVLEVGLSAEDLSLQRIEINDFKATHSQLVEGLSEQTDYFFRVTAIDNRGRPLVSDVLKLRTTEEPIFWSINNFGGTPSWDSVDIAWDTGDELTRAELRVGLSAENLSFKIILVNDMKQIHNVKVEGLSELTTYFFQVKAIDDRGRFLESEVIQVKTLEEPIFWSINNLRGTPDWNQATIEWNTGDEQTKAVLEVGLSPSDLSFRRIEINEFQQVHSVLVEGLDELTDYYFRVTAFDNRNRPLVSDVLNLRTLEMPIFWSINNFRATPDWNQVTVAWDTGDYANRAVLEVGLTAEDLSHRRIEINEFKQSHSVVVEDLNELTDYFFRVTSIDDRGRPVQSDVIQARTLEMPIFWSINNFGGIPDWNQITVAWDTGDYANKAVLDVGLSADDLSFRSIEINDFKQAHSIVVEDLNELTDYFFRVTSIDDRGRPVQSEVIKVRTLEMPIFWSINNLRGTPDWNLATIAWDTGDYQNKAVLDVGLSASDLSFRRIEINEFKNEHSVVVEGLNELTDYFFRVTSIDDRGRPVQSDVIKVRTLEMPIFWSIQGFSGTADWNFADIQWNTGDFANKAVLEVGLSADDLSLQRIEINQFKTAHNVRVDNLNELTDYFFRVTSIDDRGRPVQSEVIQLTTLEMPILWSIDNLRADGIEWNLATIRWDTPTEPTKTVLEIGLSEDDLTLIRLEIDERKESHAVLLENLSELTTYFYRVTAIDRRDRPVVSDVKQFSTPVEPILWNISDLNGDPGFTTIDLSWLTTGEDTRAIVNVGLSANDLSLQEIEIEDLKQAHAIEINGLSENTQYFIQVRAYDARDRERVSQVISVTTDEQEWTVAGLDGTTTENSASIIWQTQGTMTNAVLRVGLTPNELDLVEANITEFRTSHFITIEGLQPNTNYFFQVEARDEEGRKVVSNVLRKKTKTGSGIIGGIGGVGKDGITWRDDSHLIQAHGLTASN